MRHTRHSRIRCQQRAISDRHIEIALTYGHATYSHGDTRYLVTDRSLRGTGLERQVDRLRGLCVIVTSDGRVRTVMWDRRARLQGLFRGGR